MIQLLAKFKSEVNAFENLADKTSKSLVRFLTWVKKFQKFCKSNVQGNLFKVRAVCSCYHYCFPRDSLWKVVL